MPKPKIEITTDDLTPVLDAIFEAAVPEELRAQFDKNKQREIKQDILDQLWPGLEVLLNIANVNVSAAAEIIWEDGYRARQNDLGAADRTPNPYTPR